MPRFVFATTIMVGSGLLFVVQPMVAKGLLPVVGGAPAVWSVCLLFFQTALLGGYGLAHLLAARLDARRQTVLYAGLLLAVLAIAPPTVGRVAGASAPPPRGGPSGWVLGRLTAAVGLPVLLLAAGTSTLQRGYGSLGGRDPYPLYAASNLGSLGALLAYPALIEPRLGLAGQGRLWTAGYALLAVLDLCCAALVWRAGRAEDAERPDPAGGATPRLADLATWSALAFIPSSLMLGLTAHLSADVAPVPLLWVVPLSIYLLSFVLTFARRPPVPHGTMLGLLPIAVLMLVPALASGVRWAVWMPFHLLAFFAASMVCHGELARRRPGPGALTAFYLALAVGGAAGGLFNALIAPAVFDRLVEYPLALVLACLVPALAAPGAWPSRVRTGDVAVPLGLFVVLVPLVTDAGGALARSLELPLSLLACGLGGLVVVMHRRRPLRFALGVGAVLLGCGLWPGHDGRVLYRDRDFFGVLRVTHDDAAGLRRFFHGGTLHGQQSLDPSRRREPLAYFHPSGPAGALFAHLEARTANARVAVVGLGAGTLACYARPGQRWTFHELDPAVVRVARNPKLFTYLSDTRGATLDVVVGDARVRLADAPDHGLDLIVLDAFGSDAVPVHLLTREALALYRRKLDAGGLMLVQLSNRYLDLAPVLGALAREAGLACRVSFDLDVPAELRRAGKEPSIWGVVGPTDEALGPLATDPRWRRPHLGPSARPWTDDVSDLVSHFRLTPPRRAP